MRGASEIFIYFTIRIVQIQYKGHWLKRNMNTKSQTSFAKSNESLITFAMSIFSASSIFCVVCEAYIQQVFFETQYLSEKPLCTERLRIFSLF